MKRLTLITGFENEYCTDVLRGIYWNEFGKNIVEWTDNNNDISYAVGKYNRVLYWPENKSIQDFLDYSHQEPLHSLKQIELINVQFEDLAGNPDLNIFILTQSEYIFNALRVACKQKRIDFNDVEVIFVGEKYDLEELGKFEIGKVVEDYFMMDRIKIDKNGRCEKWPRGFFDVTTDLLCELLRT